MKLNLTNIALIVIIAVSFPVHQMLKKYLIGPKWSFATNNSGVVFVAMILFALFFSAVLLVRYIKKD
jgi:hypothetical protein